MTTAPMTVEAVPKVLLPCVMRLYPMQSPSQVTWAYVWGGTSLTTGADCSGFVQAIFRTYGISLPRTSDEQGYSGTAVSSSDMRPGDIVYYGGHIAIYIGDGLVVHASSAKTGVKISSWNYRTVLGIRNVIGD